MAKSLVVAITANTVPQIIKRLKNAIKKLESGTVSYNVETDTGATFIGRAEEEPIPKCPTLNP